MFAAHSPGMAQGSATTLATAASSARGVTAVSIDANRLWRRIEALSRITDPDRPWTRRSFSPLFLKGREWLANEFRAGGLATSIDAAGNLVGRLAGSDPNLRPIIIGSHSDTVPSGGRYDGILGVLAGLEVAQSLVERGERYAIRWRSMTSWRRSRANSGYPASAAGLSPECCPLNAGSQAA